MAKIYGLFGAMTGKLADAVMVVRNGEQIVRKYQPVVSNPSTPAQVAARARLKLLSQLAAIMSPVIAIPKQGIVSSRNLFVKANYPASSFANNNADIDFSAVTLTRSVVALPAISATRGDGGITISLTSGVLNLSRVVYAVFVRQGEEMRYSTSLVANDGGTGSQWSVQLPSQNTELFVFAYGVRDNTALATAVFGNLSVPTAEEIARIITSRALSESDITLTETQYAHLPVV